MPFALALLAPLGKIAASLAVQLMTERFAKRALVTAGRALARKTKNPDDDAIVEDVADAWGLGAED